jgi:hypothetical protein
LSIPKCASKYSGALSTGHPFRLSHEVNSKLQVKAPMPQPLNADRIAGIGIVNRLVVHRAKRNDPVMPPWRASDPVRIAGAMVYCRCPTADKAALPRNAVKVSFVSSG